MMGKQPADKPKVVKPLRLGCPTHKCKGVCHKVMVGDEYALQCPVCGVLLRTSAGCIPWYPCND